MNDKFNTASFVETMIMLVVFFATAFFRTEFKNPKAEKTVTTIWFFVSALWETEMSRQVLNGTFTPWTKAFYINMLIYLFIQTIIFVLFANVRISVGITSTAVCIYSAGTEIITALRGTPIMPSDFFSIKTAMKVAGNYEISLSKGIISVIVCYMALIMFNSHMTGKYENRGLKLRFGSLVTACCMLAGIFMTDKDACDRLGMFHQYEINRKYGIAYTMYMNLRRMKITEPDDYDSKEVFSLFEETQTDASEKVHPNIIAIMNESFSDLNVVGNVVTSKEVLPFIDSLDDSDSNVIKGNMLVSVFGGNTCNSEFEFLTGLSMFWFPTGSIPYMQYIRNHVDTICTDLKDYGYKTVAVHPFWAKSWKRESIYPLLDFDDFISGEDFALEEVKNEIDNDWDAREFGSGLEYVRSFISDRQSYKKVEEIFENKEDGKPLFVFNITMQNHGGYNDNYDDFKEDIILNGRYPLTQRYLNLIHESDTAFKELTEYFEKVDEPTIILFFGDHQPGIEERFYEKLYKKNMEDLTLEEQEKQYTVPYVIWANYDLPEVEKSDLISANYLSNLLMQTAGFKLTGKREVVAQAQAEYPAINTKAVLTKDGEWIPRSEVEEDDVLLKYHQLEYFMLFDE